MPDPQEEDARPALAVIIGGGKGRLKSGEDESEEDFELRVYATKAAGCSLDELDKEQFVAAYEMGRVLKAGDRAE